MSEEIATSIKNDPKLLSEFLYEKIFSVMLQLKSDSLPGILENQQDPENKALYRNFQDNVLSKIKNVGKGINVDDLKEKFDNLAKLEETYAEEVDKAWRPKTGKAHDASVIGARLMMQKKQLQQCIKNQEEEINKLKLDVTEKRNVISKQEQSMENLTESMNDIMK